jgi:hypothetical protein
MRHRARRSQVDGSLGILDVLMKAYRGDGAPAPDAINVLDCVECGAWFPTFEALSKHVLLRHDPLHTKRSTLEREDQEDMAKKKKGGRIPASSGGARTSTQAGKIPRSDESGGGEFNPFLKAKDVGKLGSRASLTLTGKVRISEGGQFGTQIIAECKLNGSVYDWPVKLNTPNHRWLEENLGVKTAQWKGKKVPVIVLNNLGNDYVAVQR